MRIRCREFSPLHAHRYWRYWPAKLYTPTSSRIIPINSAATGGNAEKSRGVNTRATHTWNNKVTPVSNSSRSLGPTHPNSPGTARLAS